MDMNDNCPKHEELVKEFKITNEQLKKLGTNIEDIQDILKGSIQKGKFVQGFLGRLKTIEKRQLVINTIMITILTAILLAALKFIPTIMKAAEIIK